MTAGGRADGSWVDSHCHLQERYLTEDEADPQIPGVTDVLGRAATAGVATVVCVGTDPATSRQALALADAVTDGSLGDGLPAVWATAGLHPHEASAGTEEIAEMLAEGGRRLVAVGECGLDYHYDHSPRDAQRAAFAAQIALAHHHDLALVIHAREAWDDLFDVLAAEGVPDRTVLHCFTGGPPDARRCLDAGMWISFSGIVSFKNAREVREAVELCPLDRLLVETDSPFLAPTPHRGEQNEPAFVPLVGAVVAEVKGRPPEEVARVSAANAATAFRL